MHMYIHSGASAVPCRMYERIWVLRYMFVWIYTHMCICTGMHMYIHSGAQTVPCAPPHITRRMYVRISVHVCMDVCVCVCMYIYVHLCTFTYIQVPRLYHVHRQTSPEVTTVADFLANVFEPLFAATIAPGEPRALRQRCVCMYVYICMHYRL